MNELFEWISGLSGLPVLIESIAQAITKALREILGTEDAVDALLQERVRLGWVDVWSGATLGALGLLLGLASLLSIRVGSRKANADLSLSGICLGLVSLALVLILMPWFIHRGMSQVEAPITSSAYFLINR